MLAMPGCRMLYIAHPVQLLTDAELADRAEAIFPAIARALTSPAGLSQAAGTTRPG